MRILVVAEIRLYRDGVAEPLRHLDGVHEVVTAANSAAAVLAVKRAACDVVLVDMTMNGAAELVGSMMTVRPGLKVVALAVPEDGPEVIACAQAGICSYVSRETTLAELGEVLRAAVRGEATLSGRMASGLLRYIAANAHVPQTSQPHRLTTREQQVLKLMRSGMTNRQIARALDLQLSTVKNHVHSVLSKSGAARRADILVPGFATAD